MYLRDFQIVMRSHDFDLYKRAREIWEPIELRICARIPKRFVFGDVKKVVIEVGPEPRGKPYRVLLDVGLFHYPDFDMHHFLQDSHKNQIATVVGVVRDSFRVLSQQFDTPIAWLVEELDRIQSES